MLYYIIENFTFLKEIEKIADKRIGENKVFEKNTQRINYVISKMFPACSGLVIVMAVLSLLGVFEFGSVYNGIVLIAGLIVCISPTFLIRILSPKC